MTASQAIFAQGTMFQVGDGGAPETFTNMAEVRGIDGPGLTRAEYDVTHQGSPNGYVETKPGLRDGQTVTFEVAWLPGDPTHDQDSGLIYQFHKDTVTNFRIVLVNSLGYIQFPGFVKDIGLSFPIDNVMVAPVTVRVAGKPTYSI